MAVGAQTVRRNLCTRTGEAKTDQTHTPRRGEGFLAGAGVGFEPTTFSLWA